MHQIVCYNGFYDENLEFVYLERIQIIASMTPATVVGRHKLSCRFTANVCIAYIEDPPADELENIYAIYLKTILQHENFGSGAMSNSSKKIAKFCVDTYENIKQKFSVDDHRHYLLTPKELSKWVLGIMRYEAPGAEALVEVLIYEAFRLFRDRLVNPESKAALDQLLYNQLRTHLKYGQTLGSIYFLSKVSTVPPVFPGYKTLGRLEKPDLEQTIRDTIKSYEREFKELDIILIDEMLDKFAQLERSLSQNGGHVLLAGRSGTSRSTTCKLISHMLDLVFETPKVTREYTLNDFKKYLKTLLIQAGIEDKKIVLYVEDHQMCQQEFYEYLNSLISAGEIPGLFAPEEIDPLLTNLQDELRNEFECRTVYELFVSRVSRNLRIVLSLD